MAITKITTPELFNLQSNNTEGTRLPVMTTTQRNAMTSMSNGELIFNSTTDSVEYYDLGAAAWYKIDYDPLENFNTVLYTGATSPHVINTVGFQPDLIWIKNRDTTDSYAIVDSVRGISSSTGYLASNQTTQEQFSGNMPTSVQSNGFTITGVGGRTNTGGEDYVAWCFKAGGAPSGSDKVSIDGTSFATMSAAGLTDGTSLVDKLSVNNELGFSIVKTSTGITNNTQTKTISHGLGIKPELIITKSLSNTYNWWSYVGGATGGIYDYMALNTTSAKSSGSASYPFGNPNSSVFSVNGAYVSNDIIAYCFASKPGFSKVGSYLGNGNTTGPIVPLGFEPAWLMFKCTTQSGNWIIIDNKRATSNPRTPHLRANSSGTDDTGANEYVDFTSTSFQPKGVSNYNNNSSGQTYMYLAFA